MNKGKFHGTVIRFADADNRATQEELTSLADGSYFLKSFGRISESDVPRFLDLDRAFAIAVLGAKNYFEIQNGARAACIPLVVSPSEGSIEEFALRGRFKTELWIDGSERNSGLLTCRDWFKECSYYLRGDEQCITKRWREGAPDEIKSRDKYYQPSIYEPYVLGRMYPYPVLDALTVGQGTKFQFPVWLLLQNGILRNTYKETFAALLKILGPALLTEYALGPYGFESKETALFSEDAMWKFTPKKNKGVL